MLDEALPNLQERTAVDHVNIEGGHSSPDVERRMRELRVEPVQSANCRRKPSE